MSLDNILNKRVLIICTVQEILKLFFVLTDLILHFQNHTVALFEFRRGFVFSSKFRYIFLYSLWMFWVVGIPKQFHIVISHNCNPYVFDIYLLKVNNRNTRIRCEICSKLTIKTPARRHWRLFVDSFERNSHLVLVFLLLTWNM